MPAPKYNEMQESWGWKFECGSCDHHWWLNLTNEQASLRKRTGTDDAYTDDEFYSNHFRDPKSSPYTRTQHVSTQFNDRGTYKEVRNLPVLAAKRDEEPAKKLSAPPMPRQNINHALSHKKDENSSIFWVSFTVLLIILCSILYTYQDIFHKKWLSLKITSPMIQNSAMSLPLLIQHVHWDKAVMADGKVKVAVIGEVINNNQMISKLRPLHMVAFGPCNPGETTQDKCLTGGFEYTFQKPTILPQERLAFKATWVLPKDSLVTVVNVTLLP
jgi:hypothetical protein